MTSINKILGTAMAAAFAVSMIAAPASAHSPEKRGPITSIFPAAVSPLGAAALVGTTTKTATWYTTQSVFSHWKHVFKGFKSVKVGYQNVKVGYKTVKVGYKFKKVAVYKKVPIYKKVPTYKKIAKYKDVEVKHSKSSKSRMNQGKAIVGCVMGSALGAISASVRKASALGNPPRWRSQAEHEKIVASGYEKQFELTSDEAATALAFCGLGSFALHWEKQAPVVKAKY